MGVLARFLDLLHGTEISEVGSYHPKAKLFQDAKDFLDISDACPKALRRSAEAVSFLASKSTKDNIPPGCTEGGCPKQRPGIVCTPCGEINQTVGRGPFSRYGKQRAMRRGIAKRQGRSLGQGRMLQGAAAAGVAGAAYGYGQGGYGNGGNGGYGNGGYGNGGYGNGGYGAGVGPPYPGPDGCDGQLLRSLEVCDSW